MKKIFFVIVASLVLTGCGPVNLTTKITLKGGVMKSTDSGTTYEAKVKAGEKSNIASVGVLTMVEDPLDNMIIYLGTTESGIAVSRDGAENWEKMQFPAIKVYGLAIDPRDNRVMFATGVLGNRGKIFKSTDSGETWNEVYTEPADNTVVISLAMDKNTPDTLYAGTDKGVIIQTIDGGKNWKNLYTAKGPVTVIKTDAHNTSFLYAVVHQQGLLVSKDRGETFEDVSDGLSQVNSESESVKEGSKGTVAGSKSIYSIAVDLARSGVAYMGTNQGLLRTEDFGQTFTDLNIIESSRGFPIRGLSVNPFNSQEIIYSAAKAVYRSTDGGRRWQVYQLDIDGVTNAIVYDRAEQGVIYLGLRKL